MSDAHKVFRQKHPFGTQNKVSMGKNFGQQCVLVTETVKGSTFGKVSSRGFKLVVSANCKIYTVNSNRWKFLKKKSM